VYKTQWSCLNAIVAAIVAAMVTNTVRFKANTLNRGSDLELLFVLANPILPIFAIMAIGFILGRAEWISIEEARIINRFTLTVLLPVFLFNVSATTDIANFKLLPIATYLCVEFAVFLLGFLLAFYIIKRDASESLLLGMTGVVANNAFFGLPIAIELYGPDAVQPFVAITAVDGLIGFSAIIVALGSIRQGMFSVSGLGLAVIRSPIILALIAGIGFGASGLTLTPPIVTFVNFNGAAAAPVALFALGVVLSQTRFRADPAVALFVIIKILLFPACVWAALQFVSYDAPDASMYVLAAAGPSVAMSFSLALLYNVKIDLVAQIMVWTGLLSLISMVVLA